MNTRSLRSGHLMVNALGKSGKSGHPEQKKTVFHEIYFLISNDTILHGEKS